MDSYFFWYDSCDFAKVSMICSKEALERSRDSRLTVSAASSLTAAAKTPAAATNRTSSATMIFFVLFFMSFTS